MINRLRDGLVYPAQLLNYTKDRILFVLLYIALFALLSSSRTIIEIIQYDGVSYTFRTSLSEDLAEVDADCQITNYTLACSDEVESVYIFDAFPMSIYLDNNETLNTNDYNSSYNVIVHDDELIFVFSGIQLTSMKLEMLSTQFKNLDFNDIGTDQEELFASQILGGIDEYLISSKSIWGTMLVIADFLSNFIMFIGFVLISSFFLRRRYRIIPFRDSFTLSTYASSSVFVVLAFYSLLNLPFFLVFILIFLSFRQNTLMMYEIDRRLKKPLDKE